MITLMSNSVQKVIASARSCAKFPRCLEIFTDDPVSSKWKLPGSVRILFTVGVLHSLTIVRRSLVA